jgi:hypothetical protein
MRRAKTREQYIAEVVKAWNNLPASNNAKVELMINYPDLYFSCAWLAAHETVRKERRWRR